MHWIKYLNNIIYQSMSLFVLFAENYHVNVFYDMFDKKKVKFVLCIKIDEEK